MGKKPWQLTLFQGLILLGLFLGFYYPLGRFFLGTNPFNVQENLLDAAYLLHFLSDPWNLKVIWFSFYQALGSAFFAILLGLPGAWILSHYDFPGKRIFRTLSYLPFILPSILVVLGMVLFFGNNGWVNRAAQWILGLEDPPFQFLYSLQGIFIAHVFYNFPIAMKTLGDAWERLSPQYHWVGQTLGVSRFKIWFRIYLPLIFPAVVSAFVLIFLLCLNSFAIILVLGGGIRYTNMEVLIYQLARIHLDFQGAASLALLQFCLGMLFLVSFFKKSAHPIGQALHSKRPLVQEMLAGRGGAWLVLLWLGCITVFAFGPLLAIGVDSFRAYENNQWHFTWKWYKLMFSRQADNSFLEALWNSLKIGLGSAGLSSLLGLGMATLIHQKKGWQRKIWEVGVLLPLGTSTVIFGVVWFVFFQSFLIDQVPLALTLMVVHALLTFPYWVRVVLPSLDSVPPVWPMVASSLGQTPLEYYRRILLPWLKQGLVIGFAFTFSLSLGELNSTLMIADQSLPTLPLEIYRAIASYRFSFASAVGVVLLLLSVVTFLVIEEGLHER